MPDARCTARVPSTVIAASLLVLGLAASSAAATRYDPALRFHSITTRHFVIHYHQGEETAALRLASIVEDEHETLVRALRHAPAARTHVVLVDQDDDPNGWTTVLPYNLVELRAAPPPGASMVGNTDDWLRMVFRHEYAHVLHLDPARGWAGAARRVFGRAFFAFPNLTLPLWQIEGLATYEESRAGQGRVPAGDFHAVVTEAARAGRLEPLDRVNGGLVAWPSGTGWYAYGAYFHQYLADRFGEARLADLAARTSGRAPYVTAAAFEQVFGQSLGSLWRDFEAAERGRVSAPPAGPPPIRITRHGYLTDSPRYDTDGSLLFARQEADTFPALERVRPDGTTERVTTRYGGGQASPSRDAIYFDQLDYVRSVALESDLYRLDRASGRVTRLTHGARLAEPDVSPDGRRLAAIRVNGGERRLVLIDRAALDSGREAAARAVENAAQFGNAGDVMATPRWSPDSTRIAVESRPMRGMSSILVFHPDEPGRHPDVVARSRGRTVTPAWTPDGRALVYAEAGPTDEPFNLRCVAVAGTASTQVGRQLTHLSGGARSPDVSPDGGTVAFVGYTAAGQDVFTVPLSCPGPPGGADGDDDSRGNAPRTGTMPPYATRPYRPWSTLWPHAWTPLVDTSDDEVRVGAATGGVDALGYHAWTATATWSVARSSDLEPVAPGARPDVNLFYAYDRWRPTVFARFGDETTPLRVRNGHERERPVAFREQSGDVGVTLPFRRVRFSQALIGSYRIEHDTISGPFDEGTFNRGAVRAGWTLQSAKRYGYSVSPEGGVYVGAGMERTARSLGGDGDATFARADVRGYVPLGPRHAVLAVRATGARTSGDRNVRRVLRLGGSDADAAALSFDEDASSLLRGFASGQFSGTHVALANAEYRCPLAWIERGVGTWPVFVRALHATAFFDAGQAWTTSAGSLGDWKRSWGAELSADVVAGFALPLTLTTGVAWGHDGEGNVSPTRTAYVRLGHGF